MPLTETATGEDDGCAEGDCLAGMFLPKRAHHVQPLHQRLARGWNEYHLTNKNDPKTDPAAEPKRRASLGFLMAEKSVLWPVQHVICETPPSFI